MFLVLYSQKCAHAQRGPRLLEGKSLQSFEMGVLCSALQQLQAAGFVLAGLCVYTPAPVPARFMPVKM